MRKQEVVKGHEAGVQHLCSLGSFLVAQDKAQLTMVDLVQGLAPAGVGRSLLAALAPAFTSAVAGPPIAAAAAAAGIHLLLPVCWVSPTLPLREGSCWYWGQAKVLAGAVKQHWI
jgi:hypothetical protein